MRYLAPRGGRGYDGRPREACQCASPWGEIGRMGRYARMLMLVVVLATVMGASAASASADVAVRVEAPSAAEPNALVPRTFLAAPAFTATATDGTTPTTCAADTGLAALSAAVGPAGWDATVDPSTHAVTITRI